MKKIFLHALALSALSFFAGALYADDTPDFSMIGFATLNGGTTGGEGGEVVTVTTFEELKKYAEDPTTPYIIQIPEEINTGITAYIEEGSGKITSPESGNTIETTYGEIIKLGSNKTLIGIGENGFLNRIGINIQCQSNIIIRNLKITLQDVPIDKAGENKIVGFRNGEEVLLGDPDYIGIQADDDKLPQAQRICRNIWIDHCELYNYPRATEHKDRYDGLIDIKNDVQYVTISWCHFHDHSKACLFGKGDSDRYDRTTTLHHNYFENIKGSRLPLLRHGYHHYFNNYLYGCEDGLQVRINSNAYVEGCYFEDTKKPVFGNTSSGGTATLVDVIFEGCSRLPEGYENIDGAKSSVLSSGEAFSETTFFPADFYDYSSVLHPAVEIREIVKEYTGVGKIDYSPPTSILEAKKDDRKITAGNGQILVKDARGSKVTIYSLEGRTVLSALIESEEQSFSIGEKGIYIVELVADNQKICNKVIL
ncbi:MAG: DUF6383 domain-containing protein [Candidatus Azobacteroides sp.]|nr:DUF6383 domain-containing protein [Candidatus Azobacteroides sp.]